MVTIVVTFIYYDDQTYNQEVKNLSRYGSTKIGILLRKNLQGDTLMKKILMDGDIVVIDGKEFTTEEIKEAFVEQMRFHKLSNFLETTFTEESGVNE